MQDFFLIFYFKKYIPLDRILNNNNTHVLEKKLQTKSLFIIVIVLQQ